MSNKILIKNARIINEGTSLIKDILIEGSIISKIDTEINVLSSVNIINAEGLTLIPGMIDDQVHFREPGLTHKGDIFSESRAAVAGGVTSFIEMPNTIPNTTNNSALNEKIEIAKSKSFANFSFMFGGTNYNLDDILSVDGLDVLLVGPSDLAIELGVPNMDFAGSTYQKGLDKIAAACKNHGVVPGMYFIPPGMDPNFYVDKGFKFFTLPFNNWALEGIAKGLSGIKR